VTLTLYRSGLANPYFVDFGAWLESQGLEGCPQPVISCPVTSLNSPYPLEIA